MTTTKCPRCNRPVARISAKGIVPVQGRLELRPPNEANVVRCPCGQRVVVLKGTC